MTMKGTGDGSFDRGVRVVSFRGSMATPPILYLRFAGSLAVAA